MSVLLLGGSGYIGSAFKAELHRRKIKVEAPSRRWMDYTKSEVIHHYLRTLRPEFVINAAGFTGKPNVDECEKHKAATLTGNVLLPCRIACACDDLGIPWLQVSSGCIYNGAGPWSESDEPNFSFYRPPCSFYSGSKALAEECIKAYGQGQVYICRLRLPFDEFDGPRNYLSKLQRYPRLYEATNSVSHRGDFVKAALDLWQKKAPFGIYNMTNPGYVSTQQVVMMMHSILRLDREFDFFKDDAEFYSTAAIAPRSNCVLNVIKLAKAGVEMRPVELAVKEALEKWRKE